MKNNEDSERPPTQYEAISVGKALVQGAWTGNSDFDKGMRLIQKHFGIKPAKKKPVRRKRPAP